MYVFEKKNINYDTQELYLKCTPNMRILECLAVHDGDIGRLHPSICGNFNESIIKAIMNSRLELKER